MGDVESDLRAQIAANHKGAQLIGKLIDEYSLGTVQDVSDYSSLSIRAHE